MGRNIEKFCISTNENFVFLKWKSDEASDNSPDKKKQTFLSMCDKIAEYAKKSQKQQKKLIMIFIDSKWMLFSNKMI